MPPILATLKTLPARYWCRAAAALISLYFGASFVHGVLWRGQVALLPWLLALLTSLALAALPWLWLRYHAQLFRTRTRPPTIHEQTLARAHADLVALRENAVQYRSRADGERIGLLLEQLCNHSETYLTSACFTCNCPRRSWANTIAANCCNWCATRTISYKTATNTSVPAPCATSKHAWKCCANACIPPRQNPGKTKPKTDKPAIIARLSTTLTKPP